jgi:sulfite reductase (ferredoxin)
VLRASFGQNLRLRNIPESYLPNVFHLVRELTELASGPRLVGNSIACTGADTCKLGICLSKGALSAIVERLKSSALDLNQIPDFKLNLIRLSEYLRSAYARRSRISTAMLAAIEQQMFPAYMVVAGAEIGEWQSASGKQIDRV